MPTKNKAYALLRCGTGLFQSLCFMQEISRFLQNKILLTESKRLFLGMIEN